MTDTMLLDQPVQALLQTIADPTPVPGGGSVSAFNGAMAASLVEMVATGSAKKKSLADRAEDLQQLADSANSYRKRLLNLAEEDSQAYGLVSEAYKLPKDGDEAIAKRNQAIQDGLKKAAEVPMQTAQACLNVLHLALAVADLGAPSMVTDASVAALTAAAGTEGAVLNVRINLAEITDETFRADLRDELAELMTDLGDEAENLRDLIASVAPLGAKTEG